MWIHDCLCLRSTGFWHSSGDIWSMQEWQSAVERHQEDSEAELIQILPCQTSSKLPCWQLAKVGDRCNSDLWRSNANFGAQTLDSDSWKKAVARSGFILYVPCCRWGIHLHDFQRHLTPNEIPGNFSFEGKKIFFWDLPEFFIFWGKKSQIRSPNVQSWIVQFNLVKKQFS